MDKFSYAIGLGIGQNLLGMGARGINVEDFAQAIHDVLDGKETAITHTEAREIVNNYFEEMEKRMKENMKKLGVDKQKAKDHIAQMMDYRRQLYGLIEKKKSAYIEEYERQQKERWEKEPEAQKQLEQDEIAEQAIDILNKEGED